MSFVFMNRTTASGGSTQTGALAVRSSLATVSSLYNLFSPWPTTSTSLRTSSTFPASLISKSGPPELCHVSILMPARPASTATS
jgi:hypothetical protein